MLLFSFQHLPAIFSNVSSFLHFFVLKWGKVVEESLFKQKFVFYNIGHIFWIFFRRNKFFRFGSKPKQSQVRKFRLFKGLFRPKKWPKTRPKWPNIGPNMCCCSSSLSRNSNNLPNFEKSSNREDLRIFFRFFFSYFCTNGVISLNSFTRMAGDKLGCRQAIGSHDARFGAIQDLGSQEDPLSIRSNDIGISKPKSNRS